MTKREEPKHIFVINDEPVLLSLLRELLEDEGYRATLDTFDPGGIEGQLARVREVKPDLVVLDFLIGGEPLGWQFLQALRLQRETEKLPVVVCTAAAHTVKELGSHLTEMCVGVVLKPFAIDDLLAEIKRGLEASTDDPWMLAKPS
jgi:CheY-like chemotaxis protein